MSGAGLPLGTHATWSMFCGPAIGKSSGDSTARSTHPDGKTPGNQVPGVLFATTEYHTINNQLECPGEVHREALLHQTVFIVRKRDLIGEAGGHRVC